MIKSGADLERAREHTWDLVQGRLTDRAYSVLAGAEAVHPTENSLQNQLDCQKTEKNVNKPTREKGW